MAIPTQVQDAPLLLRQRPVVYRRAVETDDLDEIFALRYRCYLDEGTIDRSADERFADVYDEDPNVFVYGIEKDDVLAASIRLHVASAEMAFGPSLATYPDILGAMLARGESFVDPSRFVVDRSMRRVMGNLPFATVRLAAMAAEHFRADHILATVRGEHVPFYKRFFDMELLSEPRPYPGLKSPLALMAGHWESIKASSYSRVPDFDSTHRERVRLFGLSRLIGLGMTALPGLNDNPSGAAADGLDAAGTPVPSLVS